MRADGDLAVQVLDDVGRAIALLRDESTDVLVLDWDERTLLSVMHPADVESVMSPAGAGTTVRAVIPLNGRA